MAENKVYITQEQEFGSVLISEEVISTIAYSSAKDVEGVAGVSTKLGDLTNLKNWNKALKITISDDNAISVDISIVAEYGQPVINVAKNVQDAISASIENMTGIKPNLVNVHVSGIAGK